MKGTYVLLIEAPRVLEISVGSIGEVIFEEGYYAYVGSGLNNLEKRIERHMRDEKKIYWHVDYLLSESKISDVFYSEGSRRRECDIAEELSEKFFSVEDFGSSDCSCVSHLFYSEDVLELRSHIVSSFKKLGMKVKRWRDGKELAGKKEE